MQLNIIRDSKARISSSIKISDRDYFDSVMHFGEALFKLITVAAVASLQDDTQRSRYGFMYNLVRADGIGRWAEILGEILQGPASSNLVTEAASLRSDFSQKYAAGSWQFDVAYAIRKALLIINPSVAAPEMKLSALAAFRDFSTIRNGTRGHGAYDSDVLTMVAKLIFPAIESISDNVSVLKFEWIYLSQNLSGKYRVVDLGNGDSKFSHLRKTVPEVRLADGIYFQAGGHRFVDLASYRIDQGRVFLPNGGFGQKRYETICYVSGEKAAVESLNYLAPPGELPESETATLRDLRVIGECLTNAPASSPEYVSRPKLETELSELLKDDRHLIVTLQGRGGVGKTSLTLKVIESISNDIRYGQICWFSARDIDLLPQGPKKVRADAITVDGFAETYTGLFTDEKRRGAEARVILESAMLRKDGDSSLFVFDNFETVAHPIEVYRWIDTYIRSPNKALITTRIRDFKGDWPIDVSGMDFEEVKSLADNLSKILGAKLPLAPADIDLVFDESGGHPYVVRMMMGDFCINGRMRKISSLATTSDELLSALFERSYAQLTEGAVRVFLTCGSWNSALPRIAVEAALAASEEERGFDVPAAVEELHKSSMIELRKAPVDGHEYFYVPLLAQTYARAKLMLSPYRSVIESDLKVLHGFGAQDFNVKSSALGPRVARFVKKVATDAALSPNSLQGNRRVLENLASSLPSLWLMIARLEQEQLSSQNRHSRARDAVAKYIELCSFGRSEADGVGIGPAWVEYFSLSDQMDDDVGKINALLGIARENAVRLVDLSRMANDYNRLLASDSIALKDVAKNSVTEELVRAMKLAMSKEEGAAVDHSRLGWLYLRLNDEVSALKEAELGLEAEPGEEHCLKLKYRLEK